MQRLFLCTLLLMRGVIADSCVLTMYRYWVFSWHPPKVVFWTFHDHYISNTPQLYTKYISNTILISILIIQTIYMHFAAHVCGRCGQLRGERGYVPGFQLTPSKSGVLYYTANISSLRVTFRHAGFANSTTNSIHVNIIFILLLLLLLLLLTDWLTYWLTNCPTY